MTARLQHVSIPRPPGSDEVPRSFYGDVLGLEEIPVPESLQHLDLIWYRLGESELHLFSEELIDDPSGRHFCMEVDNLEEIRARLIEAGHEPLPAPPIPGRPRFFCRDPYNNMIEFLAIEGDYVQLEKSGSR